MHHKTIGVLAAALTLAAVGCGGSGTLSKTELASKANAICTQLNAQNLALFKTMVPRIKAHTMSQKDALAQLKRAGTANRATALKQFAALQPPTELKTQFDQWRTGLAQAYTIGLSTAVMTDAIHTRYHALVDRVDRLERSIGVTACR